ncbi:MAG: MBOAT family protein [Oscillospiraceae bacterium]|nr:MBOAT family protein [Oscillospiraceae bacterium]
MSFNSYIFIFLFLPLSLAGYFGMNKLKLYSPAKIFLILMSFWFYGYFNPSYLIIMLASIGLNYCLSYVMLKSTKEMVRKIALVTGLVFNIGILFHFKYYDFFVSNINSAIGTSFAMKNLVLPLGISFFTFQQLSYVIDSYKKEVPVYDIFDYSLFVTFFPQLVAGPIVLHNEVVPQFADKTKKKMNADNFAKGIMAFSFGLAKKVLIADTLGRIVNFGFADIASLDATNAFIVMLSYTLQLYFDFSGYCDMATGIGYMFNIELPMNFNSPYRATTILEFWDRWHLTLTRFFTKYVYIPLGGSRRGKIRTYINVFIVFLVSGIWHGANWTFIVWGILHGLFSVFTRIFKKVFDKIPKIINWIITFTFVNLTWVIFRAESLTQAGHFFSRLFSGIRGPVTDGLLQSIALPEITALNHFIFIDKGITNQFVLYFVTGLIIFAFIASIFFRNTNEKLKNFRPTLLYCLITAFLLAYSVISLSGISTFLYFNF